MFALHDASIIEFSIFPNNVTRKLWNRQGSTQPLGTVVQLDFARSQAEVTHGGNPTGNGSSIWENFILPSAQGVKTGLLGVITQVGGIADNQRGDVQITGLVDQAWVIKASGTVSPGDPLVATTAGDLDATTAVSERVVAFFNAAADTAIATHELKAVVFNGFGSFGVDGGS